MDLKGTGGESQMAVGCLSWALSRPPGLLDRTWNNFWARSIRVRMYGHDHE